MSTGARNKLPTADETALATRSPTLDRIPTRIRDSCPLGNAIAPFPSALRLFLLLLLLLFRRSFLSFYRNELNHTAWRFLSRVREPVKSSLSLVLEEQQLKENEKLFNR